MNRQDQQAAEQLSAYIDASQQGKHTQEEFPFVEQLLAVARSIEARPTLKVRIVRAMNSRPVARRHVRWVAVAAALALVLVTFMTVPALRSFARNILNVFSVQETDRDPALEPTVTPPAGVNPEDTFGPNPSWGLTLDQIEAQIIASSDITFDLVTPSYLPVDFAFDAGIVDEFGRMVQLIYVSADRLSLFHLSLYDLANPNPAVEVKLPLGASSTIEAATIHGQAGQYAQGAYGADGMWDAKAPVQTLAWSDGDVLYILTTHEQGVKISQEDLLAIAESITQ